MRIRFLAFLALALVLFVAPSRAATCTSDGTSCSNTVSPTDTTAIFDFSSGGNGRLVVQFDTVLTTFSLTVTITHTLNALDPDEFPAGTVCIAYNTNGFLCDQYNFSATGTSGNGPDGDPVKGIDFRGLISLTLNYSSNQTVHIPAFGHAPGFNASAVYTEDILTSYVDDDAPACTLNCSDPTMGGRTPGISPFAPLDKPFAPPVPTDGYIVCGPPGLTAVPQTSTSGQNPIFEVSFQLAASEANCSTGPFLRDKTATLSVATRDINGNLTITNLINGGDSNKFHFDNKNGFNIQDINTNGLVPNTTYYVTVSSAQFSPVTTTFRK